MVTSLRQKLRTFVDKIKSIRIEQLEALLDVRPYLQGVPYWAAAAIVGLVAVVYSEAFTGSIHLVQRLFEKHPYWLFITSPVCFFIATWLVERFAPAAGGTGVPQVIDALNCDTKLQAERIDRSLELKVALVVAFSSLFSVLGAGSLGREGPMVHIAACIFYFVGRNMTRLRPYTEHRSWIIAGGAAGVAAAFNAPLAGVVFVLEELAQQHFHQFKSVVITAAIIGGVVSQWLSGRYLYFGYPHLEGVPFSAIPWAILVGIICGLLAFPFHRMVQIDWRKKLPNYFGTRLGFSVIAGLCMAALANFVTPRTIGGGIGVIEDLLFGGYVADWKLVVGRFFGTIISHLSGCAGGFLAPSLALGASIGSELAVLTGYTNHNLLVLVGMTAFLSAIVRAPFTAWVIVMEMTNRHQAIFPLMVAAVVSNATVQFITKKK